MKTLTHVAASAQIGLDEAVCQGILLKEGLFINAVPLTSKEMKLWSGIQYSDGSTSPTLQKEWLEKVVIE